MDAPTSTDLLTTVLGGVALDVRRMNGTAEAVLVRQLPLRDLPRYLQAYEDEARSVELFCDRPPGWSDGLTPESFLQILAEGERLNLDFLAGYTARLQRRREAVLPNYREMVSQVLASALPASPSSLPPSQA